MARKFILELPGIASYCNCEKLCSKLEIEHVYPKILLKKKLDRKLFLIANSDPHNLFSCCSYLNKQKGYSLLGKNYDAGIFNGMLARSCLYMNFSYNLKTEKEIVTIWNNYSLLYPPFSFEYERSEIIGKYTGKVNPFIVNYKD